LKIHSNFISNLEINQLNVLSWTQTEMLNNFINWFCWIEAYKSMAWGLEWFQWLFL